MAKSKFYSARAVSLLASSLLLGACSYNSGETKLTAQVESSRVKDFSTTNHSFVVVGVDKLEHEPQLMALSCSAHSYVHAFKKPFLSLVSALDVDGEVDFSQAPKKGDLESKSNITLEIKNVSTRLRCAQTKLYVTGCLSQMQLSMSILHNKWDRPIEKDFRQEITAKARSCEGFSDPMIMVGNAVLEEVGDYLAGVGADQN